MEHKFIQHVIRITIVLSLIASLTMGYFQDFFQATGILVGSGWACTNLYFLKKFLEECLKGSSGSSLKLYTIIGIKFPLLYLIGYGVLRVKIFSTISLISGFSLIFISIFLLGLGMIFWDKLQAKQDLTSHE